MVSGESLTHVLYHFGMKALLVALMFAVILLVFRGALRSGRSGKRKPLKAPGVSRRQRRTEHAMARRKRRG